MVEPLQPVDGLLLRAAPVVGGLEVVERQLLEREPERGGRGARSAARGVHLQAVGGPRVVAESAPDPAAAVQILAVRIEEQQRVASLRAEDLAGEHLHQVRLAHPGRREDSDVIHERLTAHSDLEVDRVLAASQEPQPQIAHPLAQEREVLGGRRRHARELRRERLRLAEIARRVDVAERSARRDLVEPLLRIAQRVGSVGGIAGHVGARGALCPRRVRRLAAVRHLDHAEKEPALALQILGGEQLAQEQIDAVERAELRLEHVFAEDPSFVCVRHRFSTSWKSWKRTSMSSSERPLRPSASRKVRRRSAIA